MSLPESPVTLSAMTVADHETQHGTIHDVLNKLLEDSTDVGDVLGRVGAGAGASSTGAFQPHFVHDNQVKAHAHTSAGLLSFTVTRDTKAVVVDATADITGIADIDMSTLGAFGEIVVQINAAGGAISFTAASDFTTVQGAVPPTLADGQSVVFVLQRLAA